MRTQLQKMICGALVAATLLSSCQLPARVARPGDAPDSDAQAVVDACYEAVDQLFAQLPHNSWSDMFLGTPDVVGLEDTQRVLVATAVDVNNVKRTSMFGRVVTECLSSRTTQLDVDVITPTVREDRLVVQKGGQFLLSRDSSDLAEDYNARTALVSTYACLEQSVIVSIKLVSTVENSTLAAVDFVLEATPGVKEMLLSTMGHGYTPYYY